MKIIKLFYLNIMKIIYIINGFFKYQIVLFIKKMINIIFITYKDNVNFKIIIYILNHIKIKNKYLLIL